MTSEVEWRRRWKPDLRSNPWQPLSIDGTMYLIQTKFTQDSYEILITNLEEFWYEKMTDAQVKKRVQKLNPSIEAPVTRILDHVQGILEHGTEEKGTILSVNFKDDDDNPGHKKMMLKITSELARMPFSWHFIGTATSGKMVSEHMIIPLLAMVGELTRRQEELIKIIQSKDKEIDDYKSQGVKASRKHIETSEFVETAFEMNMMTSKGFESQVRHFGARSFDEKGQDLYRQIMCKRAWLNRSPTRGEEESDSLMEEDGSLQSNRRSSGPSWGTSRLPPSLVGSKSPNKSPAKTPSPSKSPASKGSTPDSSPVKDTELLRRQALERRLEMEGTKKQEKAKKKKKMAF